MAFYIQLYANFLSPSPTWVTSFINDPLVSFSKEHHQDSLQSAFHIQKFPDTAIFKGNSISMYYSKKVIDWTTNLDKTKTTPLKNLLANLMYNLLYEFVAAKRVKEGWINYQNFVF